MNINTNESLVKRNSRIAQIAMVAGLAVLAGGMFISFRMPNQFGLSLAALMLGFTLSQIGIYFSNRWGRRPRPDESINQALKGLDGHYAIYHYRKPVGHVLVGPVGVWVLLPQHQRGTISYSKNRWRQRGGNFYMKIFAQESLGRPDLDVIGQVETLQDYLKSHLPEGSKVPNVQAALVFTHPKVEIDIPDDVETPAYTVTLAKLKDLVRKKAKEKTISMETVKQVQDLLSA